VLVVQTGCGALANAKYGLLLGEAAMEYAGPGLREVCEAIQVARRYGVREIISHRSGETDDVSIIHIARAASAYGVKIGAPAAERLLKYSELVRLYS